MEPLTVEAIGCNDYGPCECCGNNSRSVWGFVNSPSGTLAAYFVHWTLGRVMDHGANFDLIIGTWGEGTSSSDRCLVALAYRLRATGPEFMVIDADQRPCARNDVANTSLCRSDVIGHPIAEQAFAIADAVLAHDTRIAELLEPGSVGPG
jgi:hypothetical protein